MGKLGKYSFSLIKKAKLIFSILMAIQSAINFSLTKENSPSIKMDRREKP
jgi:hypothetical protein